MTPPDFPTFLLRELWSAYLAARKGKKHTIDEHRFELNDMENLIDLRDSILRRYYHPSRGVAFIIQDPDSTIIIMNNRNRLTPITLAGKNPFPQTIIDLLFAASLFA